MAEITKEERIKKLPKWTQAYIQMLQADIEFWKKIQIKYPSEVPATYPGD